MEHNDWAKLFHKYSNSRVEYDKNKHLFTKVAFDTFQINSSPIESLWILEEGEDGKQYLVATYDEDSTIKSESNWTAFTNKEASAITLYYKDQPVYKFAAAAYGFGKDDAYLFEKLLVKRAETDGHFVKTILEQLPEEKAQSIKSLFPELR